MKYLLIFLPVFAFGQIKFDKVQHLTAGAAITTGTYFVAHKVTKRKNLSLAAGLITGVAAGLLKEYYDSKGHGYPSRADFIYTAVGSLGATITIKLIPKKKKTIV